MVAGAVDLFPNAPDELNPPNAGGVLVEVAPNPPPALAVWPKALPLVAAPPNPPPVPEAGAACPNIGAALVPDEKALVLGTSLDPPKIAEVAELPKVEAVVAVVPKPASFDTAPPKPVPNDDPLLVAAPNIDGDDEDEPPNAVFAPVNREPLADAVDVVTTPLLLSLFVFAPNKFTAGEEAVVVGALLLPVVADAAPNTCNPLPAGVLLKPPNNGVDRLLEPPNTVAAELVAALLDAPNMVFAEFVVVFEPPNKELLPNAGGDVTPLLAATPAPLDGVASLDLA